MTYRPEVDGLRAVAVGLVIMNHAGYSAFAGGYVGVDVFFVISGFLISSIIIRDLRDDRFSILQFWERRIRRIMPMATLILLVTMAVGYVTLDPELSADVAGAALSQSIFSSNYWFAFHNDYFLLVQDIRPLTHFWSLAVEEQFYLLAPFALVALWRRLSDRVWLAIFMLIVLSATWSLWLSVSYPTWAYFDVGSRAWELGIGCLLAVVRPPSGSLSSGLRDLLGWVGLAMILLAGVFLDASSLFPMPGAILPTVGTALIIWCQSNGRTFIGRMLALRGFVGVGKISYSLYLWHLPVFVYAKHIFFYQNAPVLITGCLLISWLSWRFVEQPFRRGPTLPGRREVIAFGAICMVAVLGSSLYAYRSLSLEATIRAVPKVTSGDTVGTPNGNPPSFIVYGDSLAMAARAGIGQAADNLGIWGAEVSKVGNYGLESSNYGKVLPIAREHEIKVILVCVNWTQRNEIPGKTAEMRTVFSEWRQAGCRVILVEPPPQYSFNARSAFLRGETEHGMTRDAYRAKVDAADSSVRDACDAVFPFGDAFFEDGLSFYEKNGTLLYLDSIHLSDSGAILAAPMFEALLMRELSLAPRESDTDPSKTDTH